MIRLINGRGQLGTALDKLIKEKDETKEEIIIYHTWNFLDKSELVQKECYSKFEKFVNNNLDSKIVFISTYSEVDEPYNHYKRLSEEYLLNKQKEGRVIRLPNLIGKGICEKFRNENIKSFGKMELMTIDSAGQIILDFINSNSSIKNYNVKGTSIPAELVKKLILYGRDGR